MRKLLYIATLGADVILLPVGLLIAALWGSKLKWEDMVLTTQLKPTSWPMNSELWGGGWYAKWGGSTLGHFIMYRENPPFLTRVHEHVHVHQYQASMVRSLFVALLVLGVTGNLWLSYLIWASGYLMYLAANWLTAWIRGVAVYRDCVHEEHAYLVGDIIKWNPDQKYLMNYDKWL